MTALDHHGIKVSATGSLEVPMARDRDLRIILEERGLLDDFEAGEFVCEHCGAAITWDNLGVVVVRDSKLKFYCELSDCIEQVLER